MATEESTPPLTAESTREIPGAAPVGEEAPSYKEVRVAVSVGVDLPELVARLAQREDHHPDMNFGYNRCRVAWSTHSVGGLSMNDFICAAKVEALLDA